MGDVSLGACFINDLQATDKQCKSSGILQGMNENSRDSIFFNVNSISKNSFFYKNLFFKFFSFFFRFFQ
jgi:hypothetical protein